MGDLNLTTDEIKTILSYLPDPIQGENGWSVYDGPIVYYRCSLCDDTSDTKVPFAHRVNCPAPSILNLQKKLKNHV